MKKGCGDCRDFADFFLAYAVFLRIFFLVYAVIL